MADIPKIKYVDLALESLHGRTPQLLGRITEQGRLSRVIQTTLTNNALVIGDAGSGKTTFVQGWSSGFFEHTKQLAKIVQLDTDHFYGLSPDPALFSKYQEAFASLPACVLFIDNFGALIHNKPHIFQSMQRLLSPLLKQQNTQVILALTPEQLSWIESQDAEFIKYFELIPLKTQPKEELIALLDVALQKLGQGRFHTETETYEHIISLVERFPKLGALPGSGIKLLDECIALLKLRGERQLTKAHVTTIIADKLHIPLGQLNRDDLSVLKTLEQTLNAKIINQTQAINKITTAVQRARLGLKNPNRPLASFLVMGPSGVGKTETAKILSTLVYGTTDTFVRIDMSEFGQEHTVQRLIGAPPGYVGYESGGALTNAIKKNPYSLILLDEIEKAHPKIFDIFLQVLDDGRLTSGQGETIDFRQTIIIATSNLAVAEIIDGYTNKIDIHHDSFIRERIFPHLTSAFRPEFLNRFDSTLVFNPLSADDLMDIALLEIKKIEERMKAHRLTFRIDPEQLKQKITELADPRFGARPVKRFVEETCETLIAQSLLNSTNI